jgi:hypothetical protein
MNGGRTVVDHLLLPFRLFRADPEFPLARLPFVFALVPLYVVVRKHRTVSYLLVLAALHVAVWSQISGTIRYLAPIFPALSLAVAYVFAEAARAGRLRHQARLVAPTVVMVSLLLGSGVASILLIAERPFAQLVGAESREAYLSRVLPEYDAVRYMNEHRSEVSRLLVLGDARLYYLTTPVLVDHGLGIAVELQLAGDPTDAVVRLREAGVSHIMVAYSHLGFLTQFDPEGRVVAWIRDFEHARPAYLIAEYTKAPFVSVYRVTDQVSTESRE